MRVIVVFLMLLSICIGCSQNNYSNDSKTIDAGNAKLKIREEFQKNGDDKFIQEEIYVTSVSVDEETDTLIVGLQELNRRTEKEFKRILFDEILQGNVKLKLIQEEPAVAH